MVSMRFPCCFYTFLIFSPRKYLERTTLFINFAPEKFMKFILYGIE